MKHITSRLLCTILAVTTSHSALANTVRAKANEVLSRPTNDLEASLSFSQEVFDTVDTGQKAEMRTQSRAVHLRYNHNRPWSRVRYVTTYGLDFAFGTLSGRADDPIEDEVKQQAWMSGAFVPGIEYRSSLQTSVGVVLPLTYRSISWKVKPPFSVEDKNFSVGIGFHLIQQIFSRSSFILEIVRQHQWDSTVYSLGFQYRL